jgi:glutaredoxin 3
MAKDFFEAHNLPFTDYDVALDTAKRAEMMEKTGQMGVPVIVIDDNDVVIGFDRDKIVELLDIKA